MDLPKPNQPVRTALIGTGHRASTIYQAQSGFPNAGM